MHQNRYGGRRGHAAPSDYEYEFEYETEPGNGAPTGTTTTGAPTDAGDAPAPDAASQPAAVPLVAAMEPGGLAAPEPPPPMEPEPAPPPPYWTADGYSLQLPRRFLHRYWRRRWRPGYVVAGYGTPVYGTPPYAGYGYRAYGPSVHRAPGYRRPGWRVPGFGAVARRALTRRLGQIVRNARRIGAVRSRVSGRRYPVFAGRSRGKPFQIVTRPRGRTRFEIMDIRGDELRRELERELEMEVGQGQEQEYENDYEQDQELEYEQDYEHDLEQDYESGPAPVGAPRPRLGVPGLDSAWARLRAAVAAGRGASGDAARRRGPPGRAGAEMELYEVRPGQGAGVQLPKIQVQTSLPLPSYGPVPAGPLLITLAPRVTLKGAASRGVPSTTASLTPGQMRADFEGKVATSFGQVSLTGGVEPGRKSKIGIKLGTETIEVEIAAQANLREPFVIVLKSQTPLNRTVRFGDWVFQGKVEVSVVISAAPNPAWAGWASVARSAASAGRGIAAVARGLFFAGEIAAATTVGAFALGAGLYLGGIVWVGLSLYLIGKAHEDGRALRMGKEFSNGYAGMLTNVTSGRPVLPDTPQGRQMYWNWLRFDWRSSFERHAQLWVKHSRKDSLSEIREAGRMAAVQDFALFIQLYSPEVWKWVAAQHRAQYGEQDDVRYRAYLRVLYRQAKEGKPVGIPLVPPRGS